MMARGHLMPAEEAVLLTRSSIRCAVVEDVFATMRNGTGRVVDLDRCEAPTLIAWGDKDRLLPMDRHAERFRDGDPRRASSGCCAASATRRCGTTRRQIAELIADFAAAASAAANGQAASARDRRRAARRRPSLRRQARGADEAPAAAARAAQDAERRDERRVELAAGAAAQLVERLLLAEHRAVGARLAHRAEGVADRDDPRAERDLVAGQAVGVAARRPSARGSRARARRPRAARAPRR